MTGGHLDVGGGPGRHVRGGRSIELGQVLQHCQLDVLQLLAAVGVLHVAHADAQPVRVHVVVVVAQRLHRQPGTQASPINNKYHDLPDPMHFLLITLKRG